MARGSGRGRGAPGDNLFYTPRQSPPRPGVLRRPTGKEERGGVSSEKSLSLTGVRDPSRQHVYGSVSHFAEKTFGSCG